MVSRVYLCILQMCRCRKYYLCSSLKCISVYTFDVCTVFCLPVNCFCALLHFFFLIFLLGKFGKILVRKLIFVRLWTNLHCRLCSKKLVSYAILFFCREEYIESIASYFYVFVCVCMFMFMCVDVYVCVCSMQREVNL